MATTHGHGRRWSGRGSAAARILFWIGLAASAAGLWYFYAGRVRLERADRSPLAAPLLVRDTEGRRFDLSGLRGRVVLLNLWASWCGPCRAEVPRLNRLAGELAAKGLVVLGLNSEELGSAELDARVREMGIEFRVVVPLTPLTGSLRPAGGIPQTWLIDRQGRVRASAIGLLPEDGLRRACLRLLEEGETSAQTPGTGGGVDPGT
jgi:thiol-disulfide isomerase/thioredoxin